MERPLLFLLFAIALIAPSTAYVTDTLTVTFLDVGQGDSILVQAPNGHTILVDAGSPGGAWLATVVMAVATVDAFALVHHLAGYPDRNG